MTEPERRMTLPTATRYEDVPLSRASAMSWTGLGFLLVALVVGAMFYSFIWHTGLAHTSILFIGLPAMLGIILLLAPSSKSTTGNILRGMAAALLIVGPLVGEGYLCLLFTAPLFLVVGLVVGLIADSMREKRAKTVSCIALIFLPLMLEGVVPQLTWNRTSTGEDTQIVEATQQQVEAALSASPRIETALPRFLRIGFPRPLEVHGAGLVPGDLRTIHFSGAEGDPPGDLVMRVAEVRPGYVRFETVSDGSKLTQWLRWRSSEVTYTPVEGSHTAVTWRITFDRQLDPYWYFTPWEKLAVHEGAGYLIRANAVPASQP